MIQPFQISLHLESLSRISKLLPEDQIQPQPAFCTAQAKNDFYILKYSKTLKMCIVKKTFKNVKSILKGLTKAIRWLYFTFRPLYHTVKCLIIYNVELLLSYPHLTLPLVKHKLLESEDFHFCLCVPGT